MDELLMAMALQSAYELDTENEPIERWTWLYYYLPSKWVKHPEVKRFAETYSGPHWQKGDHCPDA